MSKVNKYQRGKIYKITSNQTDKCYIGSTCELRLCNRLGKHMTNYRAFIAGKPSRNITSYEILKYDDHIIVLVENCPCNNKEELFKRERYWIENSNCVNKVIPGRSKQESDACYYKKNENVIKIQRKEYRTKNKDVINLKHKEVVHCDICNCDFNNNHKARHNKTSKHIDNLKKDE